MARTAVILAAGFGTRMKSSLPKTLHKIAGRSMLRHLLASCEQVFDRIVVVIGPEMDAVRREAAPHACVVQQDRRGTAHAALVAAPHFGDGEVAVLYADNPLIRPETLRRLLERRAAGDAALALLAFRPADPARYGRVITRDGYVERIVEWIDAAEAERAETLCNAGVLCAAAADMARWLGEVRADNAKGEYYLTDVVALARADGGRVAAVEAPADELAGINSRAELAAAEAVVQSWLRAAAMDGGVTMTDPVVGVPVRRHRTRARRDDRAQRGVRPGREGRGRRADPRVQLTWKAASSARTASSGRMPGCAPAPNSASRCMSATSSR